MRLRHFLLIAMLISLMGYQLQAHAQNPVFTKSSISAPVNDQHFGVTLTFPILGNPYFPYVQFPLVKAASHHEMWYKNDFILWIRGLNRCGTKMSL